MSAVDDLALAVGLACLTEDRDDREQDALLRLAARVDTQRNALTVTNRREGPASRLYLAVSATRAPHAGPGRANTKTAVKLAAQAERWERRRG